MSDFETMVNPKIIALIGANEKDGSVGKVILENLLLFKRGSTQVSKEIRIFKRNIPPR